MRYFLSTILATFCSFAWSGAEATTATGSFNVTVTIAATCVVTSATHLNFGTQGVLAVNIDQTSTINVTCTNTTPYNVGLHKGLNGGSVTTRQMKSAGPALAECVS
jgi:spore coat protein U-like protein